MIPSIGLMIAAYTFTRLLAMVLDSRVHAVARVAAGISLFVIPLCTLMLIGSGTPNLR